ncbi:MAG: hypothetical protein ACOC7S_00015 [Planctomycetota bacterium]
MKFEARSISVSVSKKVPIPGQKYSSQSFGLEARYEITPDDGDDPEKVQRRIREFAEAMKLKLEAQIDGWIGRGEQGQTEQAPPEPERPVSPAVDTGSAKKSCTEAQLNYIRAILPASVGPEAIYEAYGVESLQELTERQAYEVIEVLEDECGGQPRMSGGLIAVDPEELN